MLETHCPICAAELIVKAVGPCMECGGDHPESGDYPEPEYNEYEVYFNQRLVLCNFCYVDFSAYDPVYFGFPKEKRLGLKDWNFIRAISHEAMQNDKYCPECRRRLPFLKFVEKCRQENDKDIQNGTED